MRCRTPPLVTGSGLLRAIKTSNAAKQLIDGVPLEGVPVERYKMRFKEERAKLRRHYATVFKFWRTCHFKPCRTARACMGNANACLKHGAGGVSRTVQWDARQKLLVATPKSIDGPERAARQCVPSELIGSA
jgi:hypothetical protein